MRNLVLILLVCIVGPGCAANLQVDLPQPEFEPRLIGDAKPLIREITVANKADDGKLRDEGPFSNAYIPISLATATKETVEKDLKQYLADRTDKDENSKSSLRVVIHRADSYWVMSGVDRVVFVGIFTSFADREFGLNLKVAIEIEENGKVMKTYWYDDVIKIQGSAAAPEDIRESYKELIREYREVFYRNLDLDLLARYL